MKLKLIHPSVVLIVIFIAEVAMCMPNGEWIDYPETGVELGQAWDSRSGSQKLARCIEFSPVYIQGQTTSVYLKEINDISELRENLSISAKASVSGLFGSASSSAKYLSNININQSLKYYSLSATVKNGPIFTGPYSPPGEVRYGIPEKNAHEGGSELLVNKVNNIQLTKAAGELYKKKISEFYDMCGSHFIYAMQSGAELLATISHKHLDKSTDKEIEVAIKASFLSGSGSVDTSSSEKTKLQKSELEIKALQIGGGQGIIAISQDKLKEKLETLPAEASNTPVFYDIYIVPYDVLYTGNNKSNMPVVQSVEEQLIDQYLEVKTLYSNILTYLNNPSAYYKISSDAIVLSERYRSCLMVLEEIIKSTTELEAVKNKSKNDVLNGYLSDMGGQCDLINKVKYVIANEEDSENIIKHYLPQSKILLERIKGPIFKKYYDKLDADRHQEEFFKYEVLVPTRRACEKNASHNDCLSERELNELANKFIGSTFKLRSQKEGQCLYSEGIWNNFTLLFLGDCDDGNAFVFKLDTDDQLTIVKAKKKEHEKRCIDNVDSVLRINDKSKTCKTKFKLEYGRFLRAYVDGRKIEKCIVDDSPGRYKRKNIDCSSYDAVFSD